MSEDLSSFQDSRHVCLLIANRAQVTILQQSCNASLQDKGDAIRVEGYAQASCLGFTPSQLMPKRLGYSNWTKSSVSLHTQWC